MNFDPVLMKWAEKRGGGGTGGGKNIVYAAGSLTGFSGDPVVVEHNMGVTPDLIILYTKDVYYSSTTRPYFREFVGLSSALAEAIGDVVSIVYTSTTYATTSGGYRVFKVTTSSTNRNAGFGGDKSCVDSTSVGISSYVHSANENSFSLKNSDSSSVFFESTLTYNWIAIGGLT